MSETARYPQYLRFKPGANLSFRVSGLTRFTSLTDGGSALCVGVDPDANEMPCYKRFVHVINTSTIFRYQKRRFRKAPPGYTSVSPECFFRLLLGNS